MFSLQTTAYFFVEPIADPPYSLNIDWLAWIVLYLFPYIVDMTHDNIVITNICLFPNNIIYLLLDLKALNVNKLRQEYDELSATKVQLSNTFKSSEKELKELKPEAKQFKPVFQSRIRE